MSQNGSIVIGISRRASADPQPRWILAGRRVYLDGPEPLRISRGSALGAAPAGPDRAGPQRLGCVGPWPRLTGPVRHAPHPAPVPAPAAALRPASATAPIIS